MQPDFQETVSASKETQLSTLAEGPAEGRRLVDALQQKGLTVRLLGGLAVNLRCPSARHRALNRTYADLDFVGVRKQSRALRPALEALGYSADRHFNALHGDKRLLFYDQARQRQIDIFLSVFEMCHKLVLEPRLSLHPLTLNPADLLLTKLQIHELNAKDVQDMLALLLEFEPRASTDHPGEELDARIITQLCAQDWGWYTTVDDNLARLTREASTYLEPGESTRVAQHIETLRQYLEHAPKSTGWKMRALVGRRVQWYELPEEVHR